MVKNVSLQLPEIVKSLHKQKLDAINQIILTYVPFEGIPAMDPEKTEDQRQYKDLFKALVNKYNEAGAAILQVEKIASDLKLLDDDLQFTAQFSTLGANKISQAWNLAHKNNLTLRYEGLMNKLKNMS